jgi:hypothetical protein
MILAKQGIYHRKRYKKVWVLKEDKNTSFFHHSILKRCRQSIITHIVNPDNSVSSTPLQIESFFHSYFTDIFQAKDRLVVRQLMTDANIRIPDVS